MDGLCTPLHLSALHCRPTEDHQYAVVSLHLHAAGSASPTQAQHTPHTHKKEEQPMLPPISHKWMQLHLLFP